MARENWFFEVTPDRNTDGFEEMGWYFIGAYGEEIGPYTSEDLAKAGLKHYLESL